MRECRTENPTLCNYISHPQILPLVVDKAFVSPCNLPSDPHLRDTLLNQAYVASELLASDSKLILDALLAHPVSLRLIFQSIESQSPLDPVVSLHFSKLLVSLLKTRHLPAIRVMAQRGPNFIQGVLTHLHIAPIADLLVRILDGPDPDTATSYHEKPVRTPPNDAMQLLADANILDGLAKAFVDAADQPPEDVKQEQQGINLRRQAEETMANVTNVVLGITNRVLQMPDMGCLIPDPLCIYMVPTVISRILDAGLYAMADGKKDCIPVIDNHTSHMQRVEAFTLRSHSALMHALGLAADLMTTEANIIRDEDEDNPVGMNSGSSHGVGRVGTGQPVYAGTGIGPAPPAPETSGEADGAEDASQPAEEQPPQEVLRMIEEHAKKKAGDPIVETTKLEAELAIRFPRLSAMLGSDEELEAVGDKSQPLGSLRLKLAEFFVACMKGASQQTVNQIIKLGVPKKLLALFSKYQWNSMLHGVVTRSIVFALEGEDAGLASRTAWFGAGLIPWLIESWSRNTRAEGTSGGSRAGYMGHLIRIGTALKGYIDETGDSLWADKPQESEIEAFATFSEETLAPAHHREATPLCGEQIGGGGSDGEGEEATDVLDMGSIFVENLSAAPHAPQVQLYGAQPAEIDLEDEGEIRPVEVDDLAHFGGDDDEGRDAKPLPDIAVVSNSRKDIDHDIPSKLREQLSKAEDSSAIKEIAEITPIQDVPPAPLPKHALQNAPNIHSGSTENSKDAHVANIEDSPAIIDNVDSSSEDEGSYVEFVDERAGLETAKVVSGIGSLNLEGKDTGSSLDGVITEIEEPGPLTPGANALQSLAANVVAASDDNGSSDGEYEVWQDTAKASQPHGSSTQDPDSIKSAEIEEKVTPVG